MLVMAAAMTACSGTNVDPVDEVRIGVDKTSIAADGVDKASFRVTVGERDVTDDPGTKVTYTVDGEEKTLDAKAFATTRPGEYVFRAFYSDDNLAAESVNSVKVRAVAGGESERKDYFHTLFGMQFTSIGCQNCPLLSKALRELQTENPGRIAVASFHLDYGAIADPMKTAIGERYQSRWNIFGLPTFFFDLRTSPSMINEKPVIAEEMNRVIEECRPACGVALDSEYDHSSRLLTVNVRVTSNEAASYRLLAIAVEDGIVGMQAGTDEDEYVHNNVVRKVLSDNIYGDRMNGGEPFAPGVEVSAAKKLTLAEDWNPDNMRIIAVVLSSVDEGVTYEADNTAECRVGESVEYRFND